ncbi:hypothetical protein ACJJID_10890 [Microbulbifer sp. CnH-101-G]|uniref:hypothetical protein n=1 Tax=Microbulbifer sp. CnH-101-G TaxID=3243393 RepID=UPI004039A495
MNHFIPKSVLSAALFSLALGSSTSALSQNMDTETSVIQLIFNQAPFIDIANVGNVDIIDPTVGTDATGSDDFCVGGTFGAYIITFTNPMGPDFTLMSSNGSPDLPYNVNFFNMIGGPGQSVTPGNPIPNNPVLDTLCDATVVNSRFVVDIPSTVWDGRQNDGPFTGMLELTVEGQ